VANYAEHLSQSDDYASKLGPVRAFLAYAWRQRWSTANLATHLKVSKLRNRTRASPRHAEREPVLLSRQGYDDLKAELAELQKRRPQIIEDMRRAAADKDFRENAPLDAAREARSHLEGRIAELEETLASAVIVDGEREPTRTAGLGDEVVLQDLASGGEVRYTLVSPAEVDAAAGKISAASPIGRAVMGRKQGDEVEVVVPVGKLRYRIVRIGS
jgi:transcription elongation factor GreA